MLNLLKALRQDEHGVILSTEIVVVGSLLVIGLITGLSCLQKSVNGELRDVASAIDALDQSYTFSSHRKAGGWGGQCCAWTAGSSFVNCEQNQDRCGDIIGCQGTVPLHGGDCHDCTATIGVRLHAGSCSACGGESAGCGVCGGSVRSSAGPRCLDTGVPNMRVTEWPTTSDCPTEVCPQVDGAVEIFTVPGSHEVIHESVEPVMENSVVPAPMPSTDTLPAPIPDAPAPPAQASVRGHGSRFNFPTGAF